jgi:hypothetical protein
MYTSKYINATGCLNTILLIQLLTFWTSSLVLFFYLSFLGPRGGPNLAMKVYGTPAHTGHLHFKSDSPHHVKRGVIHSLVTRAKVICQDRKDLNREII